jgi:hypothetical protein
VVLVSIPATSGNSAIFDYYVSDGTNSRAGSVITVWNGVSSTNTDYSTPDLGGGSTIDFAFKTLIVGGNLELQSVVTSGTWTVKISARVTF